MSEQTVTHQQTQQQPQAQSTQQQTHSSQRKLLVKQVLCGDAVVLQVLL